MPARLVLTSKTRGGGGEFISTPLCLQFKDDCLWVWGFLVVLELWVGVGIEAGESGVLCLACLFGVLGLGATFAKQPFFLCFLTLSWSFHSFSFLLFLRVSKLPRVAWNL